jgi:PAS domain S-box-containing protein
MTSQLIFDDFIDDSDNTFDEMALRLFNSLSNEIYMIDAGDFTLVRANKGALRGCGYELRELQEKPFMVLVPEMTPAKCAKLFAPLIQGEKEMLELDTILRRKSGTTYPVSMKLQYFDDLRPPVIVVSAQDETGKKEAEGLSNRLGRIFETSLNEIYIFDAETCNFVHVNKGARRNLGYSMEEMKGLSAWSIKPEIDEPQFREIVQPLVDGGVEVLQYEMIHQRKNGTCYPAEVYLQFFADETPPIFVAITLDISERKETEAEIRNLNQTLEERVERRTVELEKANTHLIQTLESLKNMQAQLVESEKMASLGGLVAGISHEINTPVGIGVTAISHLREESEILEKRFQQGSMKRSDLEAYLKKSNEAALIVESNLRRASDLIRSFRNVAVDQMSEEPREFLLAECLEEILMSLRPNLKQGNHKIELECDPTIRIFGQPGVLSQIATNLVMNSLIHAFDEGESGRMFLTVRQGGGDIEICYSDFGKGIPEDQVSKVFDPFFTTRRGQGGSGLGLHIVYNLVTRTLGGIIKCESEVGQGTSFTIKFTAT